MTFNSPQELTQRVVSSPRSLIAIHRCGLRPNDLLQKTMSQVSKRDQTLIQNQLALDFFNKQRQDRFDKCMEEFKNVEENGILEEEFQFVGCPTQIQNLVIAPVFMTNVASKPIQIVSNDNVINARLQKDAEIAAKEKKLKEQKEKKMKLLEQRRQEAIEQQELKNAERRAANEEKRKAFDAKLEQFQNELDFQRTQNIQLMKQKELKIQQMKEERQQQLAAEKAKLEQKIREKAVKVEVKNEKIQQHKQEKMQVMQQKEAERLQTLAYQQEQALIELRQKYQIQRTEMENRLNALEQQKEQQSLLLMERIETLDSKHQMNLQHQNQALQEKIEAQSQELRAAMKENAVRHEEKIQEFKQKALERFNKTMFDSKRFNESQQEKQETQQKALTLKFLQAQQRKDAAEQARREIAYENAIMSQKLANKDAKVQDYLIQQREVSNSNFQKSIRLDAIKAVEDEKEKKRLLKLYFGDKIVSTNIK